MDKYLIDDVSRRSVLRLAVAGLGVVSLGAASVAYAAAETITVWKTQPADAARHG